MANLVEWRKLQASNGDSHKGYVSNLNLVDILDCGRKGDYLLSFYDTGMVPCTSLDEAKSKAEELVVDWLKKAGLIIKPENCPNHYCENYGVYPTEPDGEPEQCEWCYRNENSMFNFLESMKPERPKPIERPADGLPF